MNTKHRRITIASVMVLIIVAVLMACSVKANAGETIGDSDVCEGFAAGECPPMPPECQPYIDARDDYFMDVIANYQDDLDVMEEQRDSWHEAHDRVAGYAVERNWEYAALQNEYRKLYDKFVWKSDRVNILKMKIAMLKAAQR